MKSDYLNHERKGFTLVELMVTITIMALLSAVLYASFSTARQQTRDKARMTALKEMQLAIELYKAQNGRYPNGCNGAGTWSGNSGKGNYKCPSPSDQFITGLVPEFIPDLPKDPQHSSLSGDMGYLYLVDVGGTSYKLLAYGTYEANNMTWDQDFARCPSSCDGANDASDQCTTGTDVFNTDFSHTLAVYSPGTYMCI